MAGSWILHGGTIVDGTGTAGYRGDAVFEAGRIKDLIPGGLSAAELQRIRVADEAELLDVSGLAVAPGFIDMHAHSDLAVLADKDHSAKLAQGVTLEVVGQDGLGYAPVNDAVMDAMRTQIAGWNGAPDLDYTWRSVGDYLARLDEGTPTNVAVLIPHGTVRMLVMGTDPAPATAAQIGQMQQIIRQGLEEGAFGLSAGLTYTPGMYATDEEIIEILRPVAEAGGYYCPHHRSYGAQIIEAYDACMRIGKAADVAVHIAHAHVNFPQNQGKAPHVLARLDAAIADGVDVSFDSYPYLAGSTYLSAILPSSIHQHGAEALLGLLQNPEVRAELRHEIEVLGSDGNHGIPVDWSTVQISGVSRPGNQHAVGKTISALAAEQGIEPSDTYFDLLIADNLGAGCLVHMGNEENVRTMMVHDSHTVGSDGILVGGKPHPRGWGTFPRFIGHYARDGALMSLEEAVAHASSRPAARLGLTDRGVLRVGAYADAVVLDPASIGADADYENPKKPPTGVPHVFVNGVPAILDGRRTESVSGGSVRRNALYATTTH